MPDHWLVLQRDELLDCTPWLRVIREMVRLEDGETIVPDFYRVDVPDFAMIFALTSDRRIALIEQYKHAAGRRILELPAGYLEQGEDPLVAAQRELLEECGLQARQWQKLGSFIKDGNKGCGICHAYLAFDAQAVAEPDPGDLQQQSLHLLTPQELLEVWLTGEIVEISSVGVIGMGLALIGQS
jgi:ADP-ribose pyrophosphatase